jgi:hypothetical protein
MTKRVLLTGLAIGVIVIVPLKFGVKTRGPIRRRGTKAPAAVVMRAIEQGG